MTAPLTPAEQAAKTNSEAAAFAARLAAKKSSTAQKNPFSLSPAKLAAKQAAADKAKAAEPVLTVTINTPAGQDVQTPTDPAAAAERIRQHLAALVDAVRQTNLSGGSRHTQRIRFEVEVCLA